MTQILNTNFNRFSNPVGSLKSTGIKTSSGEMFATTDPNTFWFGSFFTCEDGEVIFKFNCAVDRANAQQIRDEVIAHNGAAVKWCIANNLKVESWMETKIPEL